ncbi:hypothetical protein [Arthrobacter sp. NPDC057013]|uniref:hypothetical protein n=1 Tax=Arthrobacter sp. NPDC057013 TaxID=3345999 RepID=UPI0036442CC4
MSLHENVRTRTRPGFLTRSIATAGSIALLAGLLMAPAAQALPMETATVTEPAPAPADTAPADPAPTDPAPVDPAPADPAPVDPAPAGEPSAEATPTETAPTETSPAAPKNVSPPIIEGDPVVGGSLTSTGGQWNGAGWIQYRWIIDGIPVQTAGHVVGEPDVLNIVPSMAGKSVQLTVVASSEAQAPGTEASATAVAVRPAAFTGVVWSNAVSGKPAVGQELSVGTPQWDDSASQGALAYQWFRGAAAIGSATTSRYTVTASDVGQKLWAKVTLSAPGFTSAELSSVQVTGVSATFATAPVPTVSGTARVGQVQTANAGTWAPGGAVLSYQWYRGTAAIAGAVSRTYTTSAADYGKALKVRVRATKAGFVTKDQFSAPRAIAAGTIVATKALTVVGTHRYGSTVKVSQGWPAGTTIRYQWYRNGVAVRGGTGYALYFNASYIGSRVNVKVTVSKPGYATRSVTTGAVTVGRALINLKTAPRITGATSLGSVLTANPGTYSPAPSAYAYQWYRNGAAISGARYRTYRLTAADNGRSITVRVSASLIYSDTRVTMSPALKLPVWAVTVLRGDGTYRVGTQIKPGLYKATGTGSGCYWERLNGFGNTLDDINANYFGSARTYVQILPGDVGFRSSGCGAWTTVPSTGARATSITKDGTYRIGIDILPGDYYGSGTSSTCYMALLTGFGGTLADIYDNYFGSSDIVVTIPSWARGFEVNGCGTLTRG